jgi:uncharacterized membrane protein
VASVVGATFIDIWKLFTKITILIIIIELLRSTAQSRLNIQRTNVSKRQALSKQLRIRIVENGLVDLEYTIKQFGSLIL